jgi:hypothetical protein
VPELGRLHGVDRHVLHLDDALARATVVLRALLRRRVLDVRRRARRRLRMEGTDAHALDSFVAPPLHAYESLSAANPCVHAIHHTLMPSPNKASF